jgi:hypothetical protein
MHAPAAPSKSMWPLISEAPATHLQEPRASTSTTACHSAGAPAAGCGAAPPPASAAAGATPSGPAAAPPRGALPVPLPASSTSCRRLGPCRWLTATGMACLRGKHSGQTQQPGGSAWRRTAVAGMLTAGCAWPRPRSVTSIKLLGCIKGALRSHKLGLRGFLLRPMSLSGAGTRCYRVRQRRTVVYVSMVGR